MRLEAGITRLAAAALVLGLGVGVLIRASGRSDAHDPPGHDHRMGDASPERTGMPDDLEIAIDLENPECPIMGGDTKGEVFVHWRGLRIQFCCAGCEEGFLADPETALSEAGIEYEGALAAIERLRLATGDERDRVRAEVASSFILVEPEREDGDGR